MRYIAQNMRCKYSVAIQTALVALSALVSMAMTLQASTIPGGLDFDESFAMRVDEPLKEPAATLTLRGMCSPETLRFALAAHLTDDSRQTESTDFHPAPEPSSALLAALAAAGLLRLRKGGRRSCR